MREDIPVVFPKRITDHCIDRNSSPIEGEEQVDKHDIKSNLGREQHPNRIELFDKTTFHVNNRLLISLEWIQRAAHVASMLIRSDFFSQVAASCGVLI